jgi:tape measure domain-containing protein
MSRISTVINLIDNYTRPMRDMYRSTVATERATRQAERSVNSLQSVLNRFEVTDFSSAVTGMNQGLQIIQAGLQGVGRAIEQIDAMANVKARIDLMNDGLKETRQVQDDIYRAAQRSKSAYESMADAVGKFGLLAGDAFSNTQEIINFSELIQKSFKISGANTEMKNSAMLQLTQALGSGRLQGDEFRSITENAPILARAIAKYMDVSIGELKNLSSQGVITADIIKNAIFNSAEDIEGKFNKMPATFGDVSTKIKNRMLKELSPTFEKFITLLNDPMTIAGIDRILVGVGYLIVAFNGLLDIASEVYMFIGNNWTLIEGILVGIAGALTAYVIPAIWLQVGALWATVPPLLAQAAAWAVANWPILLVGAAIALVIWAIIKFGKESKAVISFVGGIFGVLVTEIINQFKTLYNFAIIFVEFFYNLFNDPVAAIQKLFYDLALNVINYLSTISSVLDNLLNAIPGVEVNITGSVANIRSELEKQINNVTSKNPNLINVPKLQQTSWEDGFNIGQEYGGVVGDFVVDGLQGLSGTIGDKITSLKDGFGNIGTIDKVNTVGKIDDDVSISKEDIKLMRELAEMKAIQNFIQLTPQIDTRIENINNDADSDRLLGQITEELSKEIESSVEGVFQT